MELFDFVSGMVRAHQEALLLEKQMMDEIRAEQAQLAAASAPEV